MMAVLSSERRYGAVMMALHWLTAICVTWAWLIAGTWRGGGDRSALVLHQSLGVAVFLLVVVRLLWRAYDRPPAEPMPTLIAWASRAGHLLLYLLLLAVPLTAILGRWFEGAAISVYGLGSIGPLLPSSHDLGERLLEVHETIGTLLIIVAGLHAAAALFHHFVLRDRVLRRMLPVG